MDLAAERQLWERGIYSWDALAAAAPTLLPPAQKAILSLDLAASRRALAQLDARYFLARLPPPAHARLYPDFRGKAAFLDIETSGLTTAHELATAALYDGAVVRLYVNGINMDRLHAVLQTPALLVTFNGRRFDLPFLRRIGIVSTVPHLDLCALCRELKMRGGLKRLEARLGMRRALAPGIAGPQAVELWRRYRACGDVEALRILLAYNAEDAIATERLLIHLYNRAMAGFPLFRPWPVSTNSPTDLRLDGDSDATVLRGVSMVVGSGPPREREAETKGLGLSIPPPALDAPREGVTTTFPLP